MFLLNRPLNTVVIATIVFLGTTIAWSEASQAGTLRRPQVTIGKSSEKSLDSIVNDISKSGSPIDTANSQIDAPYFDLPTAGNTSVEFSMIAEIAGQSKQNSFGIFDTSGNYYDIFKGSHSSGDSVTLDISSDGTLSLDGSLLGKVEGQYGFALKSPWQTFYTDDAKNAGSPQVLTYQGSGQQLSWNKSVIDFGGDDALFGWEDRSYKSSDKDYNDMVIIAEGLFKEPDLTAEITEIPEPGTIAGLGLVIGSLAVSRRRSTSKQ